MNFKNVEINGNKVSNYGRFVTSKIPTVLRNKDNSIVYAKSAMQNVLNLQDIKIENNEILSNGYTFKAYGVYLKDELNRSTNITVTNLKYKGKAIPKSAIIIC